MRKTGGALIGARAVLEDFTLLEGPRWVDGALVVSDFFTETVWRIAVTDDGSVQRVTAVARVDGQPSGLGVVDGRLLAVSMTSRRVVVLPDQQIYADLSEILPSEANDMCAAANGDVYVTTFGTAGIGSTALQSAPLVWIPRGGQPQIAASGLVFPNGVALSRDEDVLYVAETYAGRITAFDRDTSGRLSSPRVFAQLDNAPIPATTELGDQTRGCLPDGLATDSEDNVWMADAKGLHVRCFTKAGDEIRRISTAPHASYAVALGGRAQNLLFICCAPPNGTFDPRTTRQSVLKVALLDERPAA